MVHRMLTRYAERRGWTHTTLERSEGEANGLKSATVLVRGLYAYGLLKSEHGTHRLVRLSPFGKADKRETSFASVEVMPALDDDDDGGGGDDFVVPETELEITTMRSGGKGGQNTNKVETGVRVRHIHTGLAVRCTQERSQLMNKNLALKLLRGKLLAIAEAQKAAALSELRGDAVRAEWGQQVRNYVLHPESRVKDARTGVERHPDEVLDGALDDFVEAWLVWNNGRENGRGGSGGGGSGGGGGGGGGGG